MSRMTSTIFKFPQLSLTELVAAAIDLAQLEAASGDGAGKELLVAQAEDGLAGRAVAADGDDIRSGGSVSRATANHP